MGSSAGRSSQDDRVLEVPPSASVSVAMRRSRSPLRARRVSPCACGANRRIRSLRSRVPTPPVTQALRRSGNRLVRCSWRDPGGSDETGEEQDFGTWSQGTEFSNESLQFGIRLGRRKKLARTRQTSLEGWALHESRLRIAQTIDSVPAREGCFLQPS